MKFKSSLIYILLISALGWKGQAQTNPVLFTYGDVPVSVEEFKRVYEKSKPENAYSQSSLDEYLDLYSKFKLKVRSAEDEGLDTLIQVRRELAKYQNQLMESYFDKAVTEQLVKETYERMKTIVKVRHMFFKLDPSVSNEDTSVVYNKAMNAYRRVINRETFAMVAEEVSEDPAAKTNQGLLGWVAAGTLPITEFEDMAYSLPLREVSKVFRSDIGYHIISVEGRKPNPGIAEMAHILLKFEDMNPTESEVHNKKKRIDSIYKSIINKSSTFEDMVEKYSGDRTTNTNKGVLPKFSVGRMVTEFEDAAFALSKDGEISKPVRTIYGWHIIKRLKVEEIQNYDEMKTNIRSQVSRGTKYKNRRSAHVKYYSSLGKLKEFQANLINFARAQDSSLLRTVWKAKFVEGDQHPLLRIGEYTYTVSDFADYLELNQRRFRAATNEQVVQKAFDAWKEERIMDYSFEVKDPAYRPLMNEYRDGILLFEQTERKVWSKAMRDTMGLINYYNTNMAKYGGTEPITWIENTDAPAADDLVKVANGKLYITSDLAIAKKVRKDVRKDIKDSEILANYNLKGVIAVAIETGAFPQGRNEAADKFWQIGISKPISTDGKYVVVEITNFSEVNIRKNTAPKIDVTYPDAFKDKKGFIIADYQKELEAGWIGDLKAKYPIVIDQNVYQSLLK